METKTNLSFSKALCIYIFSPSPICLNNKFEKSSAQAFLDCCTILEIRIPISEAFQTNQIVAADMLSSAQVPNLATQSTLLTCILKLTQVILIIVVGIAPSARVPIPTILSKQSNLVFKFS